MLRLVEYMMLLVLLVLGCEAMQACPRPAAGSVVVDPPFLAAVKGHLNVTLLYQHRVDSFGNDIYCYSTPDGLQNPTLVLSPGDYLFIRLINDIPSSPGDNSTRLMPVIPSCAQLMQDSTSANIHFHGFHVSPQCGADNVISTLVDAKHAFTYQFQIPLEQPGGLYVYHYHVNGQSERAVFGGADGGILINGLENYHHVIGGLPQRTLLLRDYPVPLMDVNETDTELPVWDLSLNFVPVPYPSYLPAIIEMKTTSTELWRLVNAGADINTNLQLQYDGVPQPLQIVALDGVAVPSVQTVTTLTVGPLNRAEFIVTAPDASVSVAQLVTLRFDTGIDGENDPPRPIANIVVSESTPTPVSTVPMPTKTLTTPFPNVLDQVPNAVRSLYFSQVLLDPLVIESPTEFYITVDGETSVLYDASTPPAIVTTQGNVEIWTIENRAAETHVFHIHQLHFLVLKIDGKPLMPPVYLDVLQITAWSGNPGDPYHSIEVLMDFRGPIVGDFLFHCHILGHEDQGMMAKIQVNPAGSSSSSSSWKVGVAVGVPVGCVVLAALIIVVVLRRRRTPSIQS